MTNMTIGEMVAEDYRKADVFKKYGIDFCCGGNATLESVCTKKGIDLVEVRNAIEDLDMQVISPEEDFNRWELDSLSEYISYTHHEYVRKSVPLLYEYGKKVCLVHGDHNPELNEIFEDFEKVAAELTIHMQKEENILFPYIKRMVQAKRDGEIISQPPFGSIRNPISLMEADHNLAGDALKTMSELSNKYVPPQHACNTYKVFYAKLKEFEDDLVQHIHLENNILFPKAIELESKLFHSELI